jgi:hypothetical protein
LTWPAVCGTSAVSAPNQAHLLLFLSAPWIGTYHRTRASLPKPALRAEWTLPAWLIGSTIFAISPIGTAMDFCRFQLPAWLIGFTFTCPARCTQNLNRNFHPFLYVASTIIAVVTMFYVLLTRGGVRISR